MPQYGTTSLLSSCRSRCRRVATQSCSQGSGADGSSLCDGATRLLGAIQLGRPGLPLLGQRPWAVLKYRIQPLRVIRMGRYLLRDIIISSSITEIRTAAFRGKAMTSVRFAGPVTTIGSRVFQDNSLSSGMFSDALTSIGDHAFEDNHLAFAAFAAWPANPVPAAFALGGKAMDSCGCVLAIRSLCWELASRPMGQWKSGSTRRR